MKVAEYAQEALARARSGDVNSNYGPIFEGFLAKGLRLDEIRPARMFSLLTPGKPWAASCAGARPGFPS
jgi:hypothetical protein